MTRTFWVYIVASIGGTLYVGMTNNIERRAFEHRDGFIDGFSKKYGCKRLVYFEEFGDVRSAIAFEKRIKRWTRKRKIALIESVNPRWEDLGKDWGWQYVMPNESISEAKAQAARTRKLSANSTRQVSGDPSGAKSAPSG
jgi:putative endonuclease